MTKTEVIARAITLALPVTWPSASAEDALSAINEDAYMLPSRLTDMFGKVLENGAVPTELWSLFSNQVSGEFLNTTRDVLSDGDLVGSRNMAMGAQALGLFSEATTNAVLAAINSVALSYLRKAYLDATLPYEDATIADVQSALDYLMNNAGA